VAAISVYVSNPPTNRFGYVPGQNIAPNRNGLRAQGGRGDFQPSKTGGHKVGNGRKPTPGASAAAGGNESWVGRGRDRGENLGVALTFW